MVGRLLSLVWDEILRGFHVKLYWCTWYESFIVSIQMILGEVWLIRQYGHLLMGVKRTDYTEIEVGKPDIRPIKHTKLAMHYQRQMSQFLLSAGRIYATCYATCYANAHALLGCPCRGRWWHCCHVWLCCWSPEQLLLRLSCWLGKNHWITGIKCIYGNHRGRLSKGSKPVNTTLNSKVAAPRLPLFLQDRPRSESTNVPCTIRMAQA